MFIDRHLVKYITNFRTTSQFTSQFQKSLMEPSRPWPGSVDRLVDMLAARSCLSWPPCHKKGGKNKETGEGPEMEKKNELCSSGF